MSEAERRLVVLARPADATSADALVAFLAAHHIGAHVEGADPLAIGLGARVRVVVADDELPRARRAIESAGLSGDEAWLLAMAKPHRRSPARARGRGESRANGARRARVAATALAIAFAAAALLSR